MKESEKNIEIISGNGKSLNISNVSTHITGLKPKIKSKKKNPIVIPKANFNIDEDENSEKK